MKIGDNVNVRNSSGDIIASGEVMAISKGYALIDGKFNSIVFHDQACEMRVRVPVTSCEVR